MAPENTLAGFRHAFSVGAPWVEFDTQLSADKRCIVFHDDKLDRTTDGSGSVIDTDFETIRKLDAGAWFDPAFAGELVPSLKEVLALLLQSGLHADIEIKPAEGRETETARAVMAEVMALWPVSAPPRHCPNSATAAPPTSKPSTRANSIAVPPAARRLRADQN